MQPANPNVARLGLLGLGYSLLFSALALAPACSIATSTPLLLADGGAATPPQGDAAPDDADTGSPATDAAPSPDAAAELPYEQPPIDELEYQGVDVATFGLG